MNIIHEMQKVGLSRWLSYALLTLGIVFVVLLIFDAGIAVGIRRTLEMRGGPRGGMSEQSAEFGFGGFGVAMPHGFIPEGHGAVGTITSLTSSTITLQTRDGNSEEILIDSSTQIETATSTLTQGDLYVGQNIVALGNPHEATSSQQLKAQLIRILPPVSH